MKTAGTHAHPVIASQIANAKLLTIQIEATAKRLALLMDKLHGEEFQFCIAHDLGGEFILISPGMTRGGSSRG